MGPCTYSRRLGPLALIIALTATLGCAGGMKTVYEGTYIRTWVELDGRVSQVSGPVRLVLADGGDYEIEGSRDDLPPRGEGHYDLEDGGTLVLDDQGFATAGFDLSLVLKGTFQAARDGDALVLHQENLWGHTHDLILQRVGTVPDE